MRPQEAAMRVRVERKRNQERRGRGTSEGFFIGLFSGILTAVILVLVAFCLFLVLATRLNSGAAEIPVLLR